MSKNVQGKVYLIGAGPGAADLLTLRAAQRLAQADVVLIDAWVDRAIPQTHCPRARVIEVGKRGGCRSTPQAFINRLMLRYARHGCTVARLKGGDPFVFGRGGEERAFLERHGIAVEVVPGLTAGLSVPALAGIPVTQRTLARAVTLVTGHTATQAEPEWSRLANAGTTLVIYMGLQRLGTIVQALRTAGMPTRTPVAVLAQGSLPAEQHVVGTLDTIVDRVRLAQPVSPALIVVGDVVDFAAVRCAVDPRPDIEELTA